MSDEEDGGVGEEIYSWEAEYKRSWDVVQEDQSGSLAGAVASLVQANKRKR